MSSNQNYGLVKDSGTAKKPFTVRSLIEELQKCPNQDAPVHIYLMKTGARLQFIGVDSLFENNRMVDLNGDDTLLFDKKNAATV